MVTMSFWAVINVVVVKWFRGDYQKLCIFWIHWIHITATFSWLFWY